MNVNHIPTREEAESLLREFTKSESLIKHAYAVEAIMRAYAKKLGENEEEWGITGLLHDFDYERFPTQDQHPYVGSKILEERGYPENIRKAILSHAPYTKVERDSLMAKYLFASDELSGFVTAVALVRPGRLEGLEPGSVKKKLKDKAFARSVSREDIRQGFQEINIPEDEHIRFVIDVLRQNAEKLGLK